MQNNLYLVTFQDDSANFYEEISLGIFKPLFELEDKMIDMSKLMNKCFTNFSSGNIDCQTMFVINGRPEKISIKKIFPSNIEGRNQFFNLLEEHRVNYGGKKRTNTKSVNQKNKKKSKRKFTRKTRKNKTRRNRRR